MKLFKKRNKEKDQMAKAKKEIAEVVNDIGKQVDEVFKGWNVKKDGE